VVPACVHVPEQPPDTASEVTATLVARAITRKSFAVTEDAKALLADVAVAVLLAEVCWLRLSAKTGWYTRSSEPASSPAIMSDFAWVRGLGPTSETRKKRESCSSPRDGPGDGQSISRGQGVGAERPLCVDYRVAARVQFGLEA